MQGVLKCHRPAGENSAPENSVLCCSGALVRKGKGAACTNEGKAGWEGMENGFGNESMISVYF